jgi:hypothetical protein
LKLRYHNICKLLYFVTFGCECAAVHDRKSNLNKIFLRHNSRARAGDFEKN